MGEMADWINEQIDIPCEECGELVCDCYDDRLIIEQLLKKNRKLKKIAQEMYTDVAQYDPCNHCVEWIKQYPWLKE